MRLVSLSEKFHEQNVVVMGVLGGIAFTALVLVLQDQSFFERNVPHFPSGAVYYATIITFLPGLSFSCLMSSLCSMFIIGRLGRDKVLLEAFCLTCFVTSVMGFAVVLALLILPYGDATFELVLGFDFVLLLILGVFLRGFDPRGAAKTSGQRD
jgi:hypothetical protein